MTNITIASSVRESNRLRVTLSLPAGHSLEGLTLRGRRLLVAFQSESDPETVLSQTLTLEAALSPTESACFVKHENGQQQVVLMGPVQSPATRKTA